MRAYMIVAAGLLVLGGCAGLALPAEGPGTGYRPLRAQLLSPGPGGELRFDLSRPAHVAVFRIVPERGTELVYPGRGTASIDGWSFSGVHWVRPSGTARDRFFFSDSRSRRGPEFYFLVASERPLRLGGGIRDGYGLWSALGLDYRAASPYRTMESLVSLVVPDVGDASWTTDFFVHWPQTLHTGPQRGLVMGRCPNGYTFYVPAEYLRSAYEQLCPRQAEPPATSPPGDGEEGGVELRRRPPVPVEERISSSQLSDPERWDRASRSAVERPVEVGPGRGAVPREMNAEEARRRPTGLGRGEVEVTDPRRAPEGARRPADAEGASTSDRRGEPQNRGGSTRDRDGFRERPATGDAAPAPASPGGSAAADSQRGGPSSDPQVGPRGRPVIE